MDPTRTLQLAREAWNCGEYEQAAQHYADLDYWVSRKGMLPNPWMRNYL